ncbi:MAG TPA: methyltransferase domain-containing protein [Chitinophagaceae bacterium]|nr:methyltransferase domain-containing protein [Chitinophagaceae bacterium]
MSFKTRSYQKELLDGKDVAFADIRRNMQELDFINTYLGGHSITLAGVKALLRQRGGTKHIVEIGCGGGDNLRVIKEWADGKGIKVSLYGVDINPECIAFAESRIENNGIAFHCSDYKTFHLVEPPDIIFSSLFCHHFSDEELIYMMKWMQQNTRIGFFINDLHRHPLAYYSIKILTQIFSGSYMVKNDAPLSVKRGFRKVDWQKILTAAGIQSYHIKWKWAFRWLIIVPGKHAN